MSELFGLTGYGQAGDFCSLSTTDWIPKMQRVAFNLLLAILTALPQMLPAGQIGVTDPGTGDYPNGGMRLVSEMPSLGSSARRGAIDLESRQVYFRQGPVEGPQWIAQADLDTLEIEGTISRRPPLERPWHVVFESDESPPKILSNIQTRDGVAITEVDIPNSRLLASDELDFRGMVYACEVGLDGTVLLIADGPLSLGWFDLQSRQKLGELNLSGVFGSFVGAVYSPQAERIHILSKQSNTVHLTSVDTSTRKIVHYRRFVSEMITPTPLLIVTDSGDKLWIFDNTTLYTGAKILELDAATLDTLDTKEFGEELSRVYGGFLSADETMLVLHVSGDILTLDSQTMDIIQVNIHHSSSSAFQGHKNRQFASFVRAGTAGDRKVLSLQPLVEVESAPYERWFWTPRYLFESPPGQTSILLGDPASTIHHPGANEFQHSPLVSNGAVTFDPGREPRELLIDHSRKRLISLDRRLLSDGASQVSSYDLDSGEPVVSWNILGTSFLNSVLDESGDVLYLSRIVGPTIARLDSSTLLFQNDSALQTTGGHMAWDMALDRTRNLLLASLSSPILAAFDPISLEVVKTLDIPGESRLITLDEASGIGYVGSSSALHIIDLDVWQIVGEIPLPELHSDPITLTLGPEGRMGWVTTTSPENRISMVDLVSRSWVGSIGLETGKERTITFDMEKGRIIQMAYASIRNPAFISIAQQGYIKATRLSIPSTADVESVHLYSHQAVGNIRAAIYADGIDKTLHWQSDPTAVSVADDFLEIPIADGAPATLELPAGDYWLAWQVDNIDSVMSYAGESAGDGFLSVQDFGDFPSTLAESNVTVTGEQWAGYITAELAPIPGDIDGNGVLSVADVTLLAAMLNDHVIDEPNPEVADLNGDEVVDEADLQMLVEMIVE